MCPECVRVQPRYKPLVQYDLGKEYRRGKERYCLGKCSEGDCVLRWEEEKDLGVRDGK